MKSSLIIFAKEPEKGKVKTRLEEAFTQKECVELYKAFLKDTLKLVECVKADEKILAYESSGEASYLKGISEGLKMYRQVGSDLGERMHNAFCEASSNGSSKIVIIGSDSPTLSPSLVDEAFEKLEESDIVIGPTSDGGYYLIGLKNPWTGLFKDVEWSTERTLEDTLRNLKEAGKNAYMLSEDHDIDSPEDLKWIISDSDAAKAEHTKKILREIESKGK
ncbi:TIGR04282 family arsenosugar biosynthesis glycosyltransferase [Candidatus Omnitrophota bacterium]